MNDDRIEKTDPSTAGAPAAVNRRLLVSGAIGAGLATAGHLRLAGAQTESSTPEADVTEDPSATPDPSTSTGDTSRATSVLEHAREALAAVTADRDAVASEIDPATVNAVLDQATLLLGAAEVAVDGGDTEGALRSGAGAIQSVHAARDLVIAQLTYPGLPSQEVPASRVLARGYEGIGGIAGGSADVGFYVTTAQAVYETAYDQYGSEAYAQALANGKAIVALTGAAAILLGREGLRLPGVFDDGGFGREGREGRQGRDRGMQGPLDVQPMPDDDEPETVPAPDF